MSNSCEHHHEQNCGCGGRGAECACGEECDCNCGCECSGGGGHFQRRYQTKEERISALETYLGELKLEIQAVEEHLADLRK